MSEFKQYRRREMAELRPYVEGERMTGIAISPQDKEHGSPKPGDMIARNPKNHMDQWLVAAEYFADNFEPLKDFTMVDHTTLGDVEPTQEQQEIVRRQMSALMRVVTETPPELVDTIVCSFVITACMNTDDPEGCFESLCSAAAQGMDQLKAQRSKVN